MADPLSVIASVLGLLDIGTRCGKQLYCLIYDFRHASDELFALSNEVNDLNIVLTEVETVCLSIQNANINPKSRIFDALAIHLNRARSLLATLEKFTNLLSPTGSMKAGRLIWLKKRTHARKLQEDLRDVRRNIHSLLEITAASASVRIELGIKSLETKTLNHHDQMMSSFGQAPANRLVALEQIVQRSFDGNRISLPTSPQLIEYDVDQTLSEPTAYNLKSDEVLGAAISSNSSTQMVTPIANKASSFQPRSRQIEMALPCENLAYLRPYYPSKLTVSWFVMKFSKSHNGCDCPCHRRRRFRTPQFLDRLVGTLLVGYTGCPTFWHACKNASCLNHTSQSIEVAYYFPLWFFAKVMHLVAGTPHMGNPTIGLTLQRRLEYDSELGFFRMAETGNVKGMMSLFERRLVSPNDVDIQIGSTALHYAIRKKQFGVIEMLLSLGADIYTDEGMGLSPIQFAWKIILLKQGTPQQLSRLEELFPASGGVDVWEFSHIHKTILGIFPMSLEAEIQKPLYHAQINLVDSRGHTPLHWAAFKGDSTAAQLLLSNGADPNIPDYKGCTPIFHSVSSGSLRCVEYLLMAGANVNARSLTGTQAIHYACSNQDDVAIVATLLMAGALLDNESNYGCTPLSAAAAFNRCEIGKFCIQKGANINHLDHCGDPPLFDAISRGSYEFVELLLSQGADCKATNNVGWNLLHWTALFGDIRGSQILAQSKLSGVDVEAKDTKGRTPLQILGQRVGVPEGFANAFEFLLRSIQEANGNDQDEFVDAVEVQDSSALN